MTDVLISSVDSVYPLLEAARAHRRAEGAATGKVVLAVREDYLVL